MLFYSCDVRLSFASSFLVVNTTREQAMDSGGNSHWTRTQHRTLHMQFFIGLDVKFLVLQEAWAPPCHLELDVGHICSYGYLRVWVCVCVCVCVRGGGPLYVALYRKKELYESKFGAAWTLTPHRDWVWFKQRGGKNKVYILFYIVQNIYRPFVPLKSCSALPRPALSTMWSLYIVLYRWPVVDLIVFSCQVHFSQ